MVGTIGHFIAGRRVAGRSGRHADVFNPATGRRSTQVALASTAETGAAIEAAAAALPGWAATPAAVRAGVMFRFRQRVEEHRDELAALVTAEHGKLLSQANDSIRRGLEVVEFACGIPHLLKGEFSENVGDGADSFSLRQPVGVCVGIAPYAFPVAVPMAMFALAIACGNSFVLKPSELVPSVPLRLAELLLEAGAPPGVLNIVNGDREATDALLTDPRVGAVSFVGSTPVGEYVYATAAAHGKRVQALGGAKNHMVVMPDADLDLAVRALLDAAYGSDGRNCMGVAVAIAVGGTGDALVERLAPRVRVLRPGPGTDPDSELGPVITRQHLDKVRSHIELGIAEGATLVVDGRTVTVPGHEGGYFIGGSLLDEVTPEMRIHKEEIFGPVLSVVRAPDFRTALDLVNRHPFGNGAAIFTGDGDAARHFVSHGTIGMVGVNVPVPVPMAFHSFGGWKRSAFGDLGLFGPDGVQFYTRLKTVTARWPTGDRTRGG